MLVLKVNEVEKLQERELLKKTILFSTGNKPVQFKELGTETEPLAIAPPKELIEAVKSGMSPKKGVKKYVKSVLKNNFSGLSYINVIQIALASNKTPIILIDETTDHFKFEMKCILAVLKKFGVKPYTFKMLKEEKLFKGKKKAAKKTFAKMMNDFTIKDDSKYSAFKEKFIFEILAIDIQNQYELKDGLNKEARRKYAKRLVKALNLGKKKAVKSNMKHLKKFLKIDTLDMPKLKKVFEGKASAEEMVIIIGHMAALKAGDFASDNYFRDMGSIISKLGLTMTLKDFKAAVGVTKPAKQENK